MKRRVKDYMCGLICGLVLMLTVSITAAIYYKANEIEFTPTDTSWNATTVEDAINDIYNDNSYKLAVYASENISSGTSWNNVDTFKIVNPNYAKYDNGKYILLKSGNVNICTTSKSHSSNTLHSYARLYKNSESIFSFQANEVWRCDSIDVKKDDFIIYQIASGNTYGLGTLVIYYQ